MVVRVLAPRGRKAENVEVLGMVSGPDLVGGKMRTTLAEEVPDRRTVDRSQVILTTWLAGLPKPSGACSIRLIQSSVAASGPSSSVQVPPVASLPAGGPPCEVCSVLRTLPCGAVRSSAGTRASPPAPRPRENRANRPAPGRAPRPAPPSSSRQTGPPEDPQQLTRSTLSQWIEAGGMSPMSRMVAVVARSGVVEGPRPARTQLERQPAEEDDPVEIHL